MKKQSSKHFLLSGTFLLVFLVCLFMVSRWNLLFLRQPNNHEFNHEYFYQMEEDSVDVLFVGSSHCYCGFIPAELYEEYGISSYNLATSNQSVLASYLWAKEAYKTQHYKVLVLEAMSVPMSHGDVENDIRSLNSMGNSIHYYELMKTYKRESPKVLFPVLSFHGAWDEIGADCYKKVVFEDGDAMRGYVEIFSRAGEANTVPFMDESDETIGYLKYNYVDKLWEFCKEHDIELVMIKTPLANNSVNYWDMSRHNNLAQYCAENGIPFYDFNLEEYKTLAGINVYEDVAEDARHCNYYGARKLTRFVGELLRDEYGISSKEGTFEEESLEKYHSIISVKMKEENEK